MLDFHNHLIPAVDDGAADLDQTRQSLDAMRRAGVQTVIMTPHLRASMTEQPEGLLRVLAEVDHAFEQVQALGRDEFPGLRLERGVELMLDTPNLDLSDPRVRLAGTSFVLVEFPSMVLPPHSVQALYQLKLNGWRPIVAHPERYHNLDDLDLVDEWRSVGAFLQVNSGSLLGRYGQRVQERAWSLLRRGWADYLSSDYHARGRLAIEECSAELVRRGGAVQLDQLTRQNPARLLQDQEPEPVSPLDDRQPFWRKLLGRFG